MGSLLGRKPEQSSASTGKTGLLGRLESDPKPSRPVTSGVDTQPGPDRPSSRAIGLDARRKEQFRDISNIVQERVLASSINLDDPDSPEAREALEEIFSTVLTEEQLTLNRNERIQLFEQVIDNLLGFGPLEDLLADDDTTDIMVVGPDRVFVERKGRIFQTKVSFEDEEHLLQIIDRIVAPLGRRIDESSPMVDARLPDGSRVNAVIRPVALDGPSLTIRKFSDIPIGASDLVNFGTATPDVLEFLSACVKAGANMLIAGGSSSGKTTLLNILSSFIPNDERIVTIENAAELQLFQDHVVRMESRSANVEGEGLVTIRELVINSLRMRPDRIVLGEVRSAEAIDLLQAMNTGHDGSMSTLHANSPVDAIARLETMCLMAGMNLPVRAIREQVSAAVDVVVQMARLRDGTRKITAVSEIVGMEGDTVMLSNLFEYEQTGIDAQGMIIGRLKPTGLEPARIGGRIEATGIRLTPTIFNPRPLTPANPPRPATTQSESQSVTSTDTGSSSPGSGVD